MTPCYRARELASIVGQPAPTEEQAAVIEAPLEPTLVVAGAGSGKTETMSARVIYLIANGLVEPDRILGLTFTRKAAGELAERIRARLARLATAGVLPAGHDLGLGQPQVATYHAYAASLVRDHGLRIGCDPQSDLLGQGARWQLGRALIESRDTELDTDYSVGYLVDKLLALSDAVAEHRIEPADAKSEMVAMLAEISDKPAEGRKKRPGATMAAAVRALNTRIQLMDLVERYQQIKRDRGVLDYADQIALASQLADIDVVPRSERSRYRAVLLDEYQDTSAGQAKLLRTLFGASHPVMAVGDPHQSIYGWRGASAGGLARFRTDFPAGGEPAQVLTLSTAWRNDRTILAAANRIAAPLRADSDLPLPSLRPRPAAGNGVVSAHYAQTLEEEAHHLASELGQHWWHDGRPQGTAAILCRKRSQFAPIVLALRAAGLPVEVIGLGGLLTTPEVVDIVATLQAVHDPGRADSLMRLLTGARTQLGAVDLLVLGAWTGQLSAQDRRGAGLDPMEDSRTLVDVMDQLPPAAWHDNQGRTLSAAGRRRCEDLARIVGGLRRQTFLPLPELVVATERALGIDIELLAKAPDGSGRAHVEALIDVARTFAARADATISLGAFLDWLEAAQQQENGLEPAQIEPDTHRIQVLTVHAAKGLEWDIVAVPGLSNGVLPALDASEIPLDSGWLTDVGELPYELRADAEDLPRLNLAEAFTIRELDELCAEFRQRCGRHQLAEERRVAYVALTRARSRLMLSGSWWQSATRPREPSRFLTELTASDLAVADQWPAPAETNPRLAQVTSEHWPPDPIRSRRPATERAAKAVLDVLAAGSEPTAAADGASPTWHDAWLQARVLLAERDHDRGGITAQLPAHLSATELVRLAADPTAFAIDLRRPIPREPKPGARLGTAMHAWIEQQLGTPALIDDTAWPPDDEAVDAARLREVFWRSPWLDPAAGWSVVGTEVDIETPLAGGTLRCRLDAVFCDREGRIEIVDWKTGRPPASPAQAAARRVQLAAYRLAWSRWKHQPLAEVSAAFCYLADNRIERPANQMSAEEILALLPAN